MSTTLDGPRLAPASGGAAHQIVVLLHGYGANGDDLIALGREWRQRLPDAAFVAPNAPEPIAMSPFGGLQWFELTFRNERELWRGAQAAAPVLEAFLDEELKRHDLDERALALVGFSQGTMMALHVGLRRSLAPAAIVGFSGVIAGPEHLAAQITVRPPVLLIHGETDDVIPAEAIHLTREALAGADVLVEWHIRPGLGHGIDAEGLALGGTFLSDAFKATGR